MPAAAVVVHGFDTSNNMKVRVALGYKGIPYEFRMIDPADRREIVRVSGQHLTPVLVHGDRVVFDSAAILRYLDANFRDTPALFGGSRDEQWAIEDWEMFARSQLAGPMMEFVHARIARGKVEPGLQERCESAFAAAARKVFAGLEGREWLATDRMSAADITAAAIVHRIRAASMFPIPDGPDRVASWISDVMQFDGKCRLP